MTFGALTIPFLIGLPNLYYAWLFNCDPLLITSSTLARSLLRWTSIQLALTGGVNYGIAEVFYEVEPGIRESQRVRRQLIYSFIPAAWAHYITSTILFTTDITSSLISAGFGSLVCLQVTTLLVDLIFTKQKMMPIWYAKLRIWSTIAQVWFTLSLFYIYSKYQKRTVLSPDINRIKGIKNAVQLEVEDDKLLFEEIADDINGVDLEPILSSPPEYHLIEISLKGDSENKIQ